ncbi:MAG: DUF4334 domain-containing protein [Nannocystaceae bacterium]
MRDADELTELLAAEGEQVLARLFEFYDRLPALDPGSLRGAWEGGCFRTGHPGERQLETIGWVGKAFHGDDDVDPILSRGEDGGRIVNPIMGKASLRSVTYRGVTTATMIYDRHPIFDHFRRVDDDTILGVMDRKGDAFPLFFYLRRAPAAVDAP